MTSPNWLPQLLVYCCSGGIECWARMRTEARQTLVKPFKKEAAQLTPHQWYPSHIVAALYFKHLGKNILPIYQQTLISAAQTQELNKN